jgi:cytohesin
MWLLPGVLAGLVALCAVASAQEKAAKETKFDKVGPQPGDQLPALNMRTLKGEVQKLSDAWKGGPALLVTSSLTCPKSRSRWPELKEIVDEYGEKINVVIVYVIEAHPVGSICPYKGVEDITPENERDGILRKQPKTLEDRIELAQEFKRLLRISIPIYVDDVKDEAWKGLGAAPNLALLVDERGIVVAREGWFEGKAMGEKIEAYLKAEQPQARVERSDKEEEAQQNIFEKSGIEDYEFRSYFYPFDANQRIKDLEQALKKSPALANAVISAQQGHPYETTALMEAAHEKNLPAVELLLKHGANVKTRTHSYDSALQIAAEQGDLKIVQTLLRHKADPNLPRTGRSPLHQAALEGHAEVAKALIAAGAKADLYSDIALGNIAAVRKQIAEDPSRAQRPDGADRSPLDYAAANGQHEIAKLLLASGAPVVTEKHVRLEPPLHRAIERNDEAMVKPLLDAGSSPDVKVGRGGEDSGWTPALHLAIQKGNAAIVEMLIAAKADLAARNTYSLTPLHLAAEYGHADIVAILVKAGADVNALQGGFSLPCGSGEERKPSQNTPLHYAAARGNPETIQALLKAGAELEAANAKGETPLMSAVTPPIYTGIEEKTRLKNIEALLAAGANINARDKQGQTVLDQARAEQNSGDRYKDIAQVVALLEKHQPRAKPSVPARSKAK